MRHFSLFLLVVCSFVGITSAAQVYIAPQYEDPRFTPANSFHVGCSDNVDVGMITENDGVSSFRLIFGYDPKALQVVQVKPNVQFKDILDTKIEDNKVILTLLDTPLENQSEVSLAQIVVKTNEGFTGTMLRIRDTSYLLTKGGKKITVHTGVFAPIASAQECDPDTTPPVMSLVSPIGSGRIALDQQFVFKVTDAGKGVDHQRMMVMMNDVQLTGIDSSLTWKGDQFSFQLPDWLPINKTVKFVFTIADKQKYGGVNTGTKAFTFRTATGIVFEKGISPKMFRQIVAQADRITLDTDTCFMVAKHAGELDSGLLPQKIKDALAKANCPSELVSQGWVQGHNEKKQKDQKFSLSSFSLLGWGLFVISLLLKLHYLVSYRKHKKKNSERI